MLAALRNANRLNASRLPLLRWVSIELPHFSAQRYKPYLLSDVARDDRREAAIASIECQHRVVCISLCC